MPFDWKSLADVARNLEKEASKGDADAEAQRRSAIGRAYYAAFGHARNYAKKFLGYAIKGDADDHGALRAHLKRSRRGGDAQRLDSLRQWRNDADYSDDLPWDDAAMIVAEAIKAAEKVFKSLTPPAASSAGE
jgi:hypothetical protein